MVDLSELILEWQDLLICFSNTATRSDSENELDFFERTECLT